MYSQGQTDLCETLCLNECHVCLLMESLAEVSDKWRELGIALGLPGHVLNDCRGINNIISLDNILREWIKGNRSPVTLVTLKLALNGRLVGRPVVARALMEKSFTVASLPPAAISQNSSFPESQHLIDLYSVYRVIPADTWPPAVHAATFINLVLINNNKQETGDYNYSLRGDLDDILASKEKIEYEEVFGQYESGALVLVEGRPGSGKTTLVHKVIRDWATTGNTLSTANMVFLISLRNLGEGNDQSLTDILANFYRGKREVLEKVLSHISSCNGMGVCFIVDGLDEYQPQDKSKSLIYDLLTKTYLPKSMIIVASRPVATSTLRNEAPVTKQIEVLGFTREQIFEYMDKFFSSTDASILRAYLHSHRNIMDICYLPMHASMICFLYQQEKGEIPHTETKIYEKFTKYIVLRQLRRNNVNAQLRSLEDLHGEKKEYFRNVCKLALDMTIQSKQVVQQDDTNVLLSHGDEPIDTPSLGLVTIDNTAQQYGLDNTYCFLHLTFQEYLAALYLATLKEEEQVEIIRLHAGETHMWMVWKLYCGMVEFEGRLAQIQLILQSAPLLYRVQCALESQQAIVCDLVTVEETGVLSFNGTTLTPGDLTAIGYTVSTTSNPVRQLSMSECGLQGDHFEVLMSRVSNNKLKCIATLDLSWNNIGDDGIQALAEALNSCNNLQTLNLSGNNIHADGALALVDGLQFCKNLQALYLSDNKVGAYGARSIAEALKFCNNLQTLKLSDNNIGADGARALAEPLKYCNNLQTLELRDNNIGADGARALAEALKFCNNLQTLDLRDNNIGCNGARALAVALQSCNNLQTLNLQWNNIGADAARDLAEALTSCNKLQALYLSGNNIGAHSAPPLANLKRRIPYCYY